MKIDVFDINEFIKVNKCQEVTNPIYIERDGFLTNDGILSAEIFGRPGSYDRKTIFGYIDLKRKFIHPLVYKVITKLNRKIENIIAGTGFYVIDKSGNFVEDEDKGETGIDFIQKNWSKIKWRESDSMARSDKLKLLKHLSLNEIFIDKWIIIPAFYRDVNIMDIGKGKISDDQINALYVRLLGSTKLIENKSATSFDFVQNNTISKIQFTINEIYNYLIDTLPKKKGLLHKALLGKIVDYSTRGVISNAKLDAIHWNKQTVPFGYTGVPLSHAINLFYPFLINDFRKFIEMNLGDEELGKTEDPDAAEYIKGYFTPERLKKILNGYINSVTTRFEYLKVPAKNSKKHKYYELTFNDVIGKPLTITEILYILTQRIVDKKHIYVKRYPVENHHSVYASKIKLLTTIKVKPTIIEEYVYDNYPDVEFHKNDASKAFIDTILLNSSYTVALGADFDGDTVGLHGVYSAEANQEADEIIKSKKYVLDANGKLCRLIDSKELISTIYNFTREE